MEKKRRRLHGLVRKINRHRVPLVGPYKLPILTEGIALLITIGHYKVEFFQADRFVVNRKLLHQSVYTGPTLIIQFNIKDSWPVS